MPTDHQGNPLPGANAIAADHYNNAIRAFNIYRGDPIALADQAIDAAPDFVMPHILKAYLLGLATEPAAAAAARQILARVVDRATTDAERSHINALQHLLANNWTQAGLALDHHSMRYPHDLLALQAGVLVDFYRGNARNLRDRIARVLPQWDEQRPGYAIVLGLYAFGLEETGNYAKAEAFGREAVAREPLDAWAHHAVAHVMEMQGRAEDGLGWMIAREPHWSGDDNFIQVHNWWHKALFHFDLGQDSEVLSLYDTRVRAGQSEVALDLVDASALLWRMHLHDFDLQSRWAEVAERWESHADGVLYPFNDWHAAMAFLGDGRMAAVDRLIARYRSDSQPQTEAARWAQATGLPLIEGFKAFWLGNYDQAVTLLHQGRAIANSFGGSHAQRDVIDWTLVEAALRANNRGVAEAIAQERIALKPLSPLNNGYLRRAKAAALTPETLAA